MAQYVSLLKQRVEICKYFSRCHLVCANLIKLKLIVTKINMPYTFRSLYEALGNLLELVDS